MKRLFRWALSSYWTWLIYLCVISPFPLIALVLQHVWVLVTAVFHGLHELHLAWQQELRPLWSSYIDLWTPTTHRRARSLARGAVLYGRIA